MAKVIQTADQLNFTKIIVNAESVGPTPDQFVRLCSDKPDLIQPGKRQVFIYRQDRQPEHLDNPASVTGDPLLPGFTLDLTEIWEQRD